MEFRSHCPINYALEHIGDKWSLLILRDLMFKGKRHYNEFLEGGERVSTSVLGARLRHLEDVGLISRGKDDVKKSRIKYSLTQKGIDLLPLMIDMILWGGTYDKDTATGADFLDKATQKRDDLLHAIRENLIKEHL